MYSELNAYFLSPLQENNKRTHKQTHKYAHTHTHTHTRARNTHTHTHTRFKQLKKIISFSFVSFNICFFNLLCACHGMKKNDVFRSLSKSFFFNIIFKVMLFLNNVILLKTKKKENYDILKQKNFPYYVFESHHQNQQFFSVKMLLPFRCITKFL